MKKRSIKLLAIIMCFFLYACGSGSDENIQNDLDAKNEGKRGDSDIDLISNTSPISDIPLGPLGANVIPLAYQIEFTLIPEEKSYQGKISIDIEIKQETRHFYIHGKDLSIQSVSLYQLGNRIDADYIQVHSSGIARIDFGNELIGRYSLAIEYQADYSLSLDAIYQVKESDRSYLFSQMEAISARMAFPSFDEPGFKTPFDISIISEAKNEVITNTKEISQQVLPNGLVKHTFATTKKLPTYLLTFAVGEFDIVEWESLPATEVRAKSIPLRGIAVKGKGEKLKYALENTKPILEALESYFKTPYPYEKLDLIAAPDFAFGAMENAGAIVYRESLLLLDENSPTWQKRAYGSVHAHELGHQWFGNLVTPKWWDDIWLNEAFATWVSYKAVQKWKPEFEFDRGLTNRAHGAMRVDARSSARQIRNAINTNNDIMNAFDGITYSKGGGVLQMFESFLGEEKFQKGVQLHMQRYAHGNANINDFLGSLADGSGQQDLIPAFESFLYQSGVPSLKIDRKCVDGKETITVEQSRYIPLGIDKIKDQNWKIPFCYRTENQLENGTSTCKLLTEKHNKISLNQCSEIFLPNSDAAGYYRWNLGEKDWLALLDSFEELNGSEKVSFASNVIAGFKANEISANILLKTFSKLVTSKNWDVANIPLNNLRSFKNIFLEGEDNENYRNIVGLLYKKSFNKLGFIANTKEDKLNKVGTALKRKTAISALALDANDLFVQNELLKMLEKYLGDLKIPAIELDTNAIPSDLIPIAMAVAINRENEEYVNLLMKHGLSSTDSIFRGNVLTALTSIKRMKFGVVIMKELMSNEQVRSNESQRLLNGFMSNHVLRDETWSWLQSNLENFLTNYSSFSIARIVSSGQYFCNEINKEKMKKFFTDNQSKISGAPRKILETAEVIDQCIALRKAKTEEFSNAISI